MIKCWFTLRIMKFTHIHMFDDTHTHTHTPSNTLQINTKKNINTQNKINDISIQDKDKDDYPYDKSKKTDIGRVERNKLWNELIEKDMIGPTWKEDECRHFIHSSIVNLCQRMFTPHIQMFMHTHGVN
eukprot:GHVR01018470.1.p2 GENE.GHVR01018470.1~~GHVR01018470.1.p2  ORF type:complete len:128 (+),score=38.56 GHVR01018470.1:1-384(+)